MTEMIKPMAELCAAIIEALGVGLITIFAIYALLYWAYKRMRGGETEKVFHESRQLLGQGILLGLEFLVAADIIHTVAVELTFKTVGVLAIVVFIRTFLSFTLDVELTGRWPWQKREKKT